MRPLRPVFQALESPQTERSFMMTETVTSPHSRRPLAGEAKTAKQVGHFLPSKAKPSDNIPVPQWNKAADRHGDGRTWASPTYTEEGRSLPSGGWLITDPSPQSGHDPQSPPLRWVYEYESQSDSDVDRPEPDVVLDDLASRRFRSPVPVTPVNFAVPMSPREGRTVTRVPRQLVTVPHAPLQSLAYFSSASPSPPARGVRVYSGRAVLEDIPLREMYEDSDEEDEEVGYADPVQDDLYTRRMGQSLQAPKNTGYDKFLPKYWTPEEDAHVRRIRLGSQRRPWYRKMQGFSRKRTGSSSEDSDCDISPWLAAPSPAQI
ncbi:hypothetical protein MATL_G00178050 [Megalops atlanticus]|uniref:Uncharacterized protein n=1 Tax=Megalops atlanticus TaxID=7932 RepID=A0A9D3T6Y5_MEGAT|nr:hypothetical protein MATL_G00178050 [Megalops atlanticus]